MRHIKTSFNEFVNESKVDHIDEGFVDKLKIYGLGAMLAASVASCKKMDTPTPTNVNKNTIDTTKSPIDTTKSPKPINMSINGTWLPIDQCRIDLDEMFEITNDKFVWYTDFFGTQKPTTSNHISKLKSFAENDEINISFFDIDTTAKKITFYTRVGKGGEIMPNYEYRESNKFTLYVNASGNLIFDVWTYKRK